MESSSPSPSFFSFFAGNPASSRISSPIAFISFAVSTVDTCSCVLSTNSRCPVRLLWMSFSVSERHGLPQATQLRFKTASVDSAKSECPVLSPCTCASATERSCTPQVLHRNDSAADIAGDATGGESATKTTTSSPCRSDLTTTEGRLRGRGVFVGRAGKYFGVYGWPAADQRARVLDTHFCPSARTETPREVSLRASISELTDLASTLRDVRERGGMRAHSIRVAQKPQT